jgi:hypothetical protein
VRYLRGAERAWERLLTLWREDLQLFLPASGEAELRVADVAEILSAFHARIVILGSEEAKERYAQFLEGLKRSGLLRAEGQEAGGSYDGDPVPDVLDAGEPPVLIAAVRYDPETGWRVEDRRFLTAPALHAAAVWLWLGRFQGEAFAGPPPYGVPLSPLAQQLHLPRRLSALEEALWGLQDELAQLETRLEAQERALAELQLPEEPALAEDLRALEAKLLRQLEEQRQRMRALREEILQQLPPPVDEEALSRRLQALLEERLAERLAPQLEALTEGLARLQEKLETLSAEPQKQIGEELARLQAQLRNLIERVSALEERERGRWPLRPEVLLLALGILGLALLIVGFLQLRRLRGPQT